MTVCDRTSDPTWYDRHPDPFGVLRLPDDGAHPPCLYCDDPAAYPVEAPAFCLDHCGGWTETYKLPPRQRSMLTPVPSPVL